MEAIQEDLKAIFADKRATLVAQLETWFEEEVASIDGTIEASAPAGTGGSIMSVRPAIDSKRVVDARVVTKRVLNIDLPPQIIKPGGYASCAEMISDIVPKLERVFIGDIKVRTRKPVKEPVPA